MDILEKGKLFLFVLFIMPGFISMRVYRLFHPSADSDTSKVLIDVVSYSCINFSILLIPIYLIEINNVFISHPVLYYLFYIFVLIIVPVLLPIILLKIRSCEKVKQVLPHPIGRSWDYFFSTRQCCWVLVTLKNGKKYGGYYGSQSFASNSPEPEQIYLEKHWALDDDGDFDHELTDTLGIIILTNEIESVEFIKVKTLEPNNSEEENG
ncbi:hypothetical protein ZZ78_02080 [Salmonella enterica subsp. enterica serovar Infantis]|uniref:Uncharacterized protein n=3 Tax=Salmonella enterica TaxID=28901 RepID=A0A762KBA8_SALER|nr:MULTISPECIES: DUF6338 family protein [Enterobacteriaceae]EBN0111044.1 hypothetical protein [Salmonella enterica subsp. enterica serovar Infantis]EBV2052434.1 hypothetical protein [Salmonella enterica subsp. enterica serovar Braenderup]EBV2358805.1 hypothetical protein [Salmonella enterica subsp. enterica serovar Ago]EBX3117219.1 hypothetical protein [Salmonella enterica subsp. enterica serovar Virchow]ECA0142421.1 hypothetical protein [Salmonella enterica subsp. enterica serovar Colindale]